MPASRSHLQSLALVDVQKKSMATTILLLGTAYHDHDSVAVVGLSLSALFS